jgi:hypothetical protein
MDIPSAERNTRVNELKDHYSTAADMANTGNDMRGALGSLLLSAGMELGVRPLAQKFPDLANKYGQGVFNFKTAKSNKPGAIDPYKKGSWREAVENFGAEGMGALDKFPRVRKLFGWGDDDKF